MVKQLPSIANLIAANVDYLESQDEVVDIDSCGVDDIARLKLMLKRVSFTPERLHLLLLSGLFYCVCISCFLL